MADVFHQLYVQVVFAVRNSRSQLDEVCKYVLNQKAHHIKITFKDEFISMIEEFNVRHLRCRSNTSDCFSTIV